MKCRESQGGEESSSRRDRWKRKKNNEKRLGGKALSLESFANAKSGPSGYNPAIIKKQREFYRNAKYVSKFKKSVKRERAESRLPVAAGLEEAQHDENEKRRRTNNKKKISLKTISEDVEKKRAEAEKTKMEREAAIQARNEERAKAEAKRKSQRENMFKKTRSGQPVMKYRVEHLLQGILNESTK